MMRFIFSSCVCALTLSLLTLSFHEISIIRLWNLWCAASSFSFCATVRGHNSAPFNIVYITNDSYNLTLSVLLICLFFHTDFNLPNTLLALPILVDNLCRSYCYLSHNCPGNKIPRLSQLKHFLVGFPCYQPNRLRSLILHLSTFICNPGTPNIQKLVGQHKT